MIKIVKIISTLFALLVGNLSLAATLLPPGEQTFFDSNGNPLASGFVYFYIPNTTTLKTTWKDAGQTIANTNPVVLDAAGRAIIYGSGAYRQIVRDGKGNLIWDQLTADTASNQNSWGGTSTGSANVQVVSAANFSNNSGQSISFLAGFTNTGTLTLNGISVLKDTGLGPVGLSGGEVIINDQYTVVYDSGLGAFHLVTFNIPYIQAAVSIASAATTDLGTIRTHNASVTGTTGITSFGSSASVTAPFYIVNFTGALTITAGANIITSDGKDVKTVANTVLTLYYRGAGIWQIINSTAAQVPTGMLAMFNLATCPAGWQFADGTGVTADLRGRFPRGFDNGAGINEGNAVAALQTQQLQDHTHNVAVTIGFNLAAGTAPYLNGPGVSAFGTTNPVTGSHGAETRPYTTVLLACQKL